MKEPETIGTYIALDWYDGPLLEIARVDFADADRMIQVCSLCTVTPEERPPSDRLRGTASGEEPWTRTVIRLSRGDLCKMIDLIDGKPVRGYLDEDALEEEVPASPGSPSVVSETDG